MFMYYKSFGCTHIIGTWNIICQLVIQSNNIKYLIDTYLSTVEEHINNFN